MPRKILQSLSFNILSRDGAGASAVSPSVYLGLGIGVGGAILIAVIVVTVQIVKKRKEHKRLLEALEVEQAVQVSIVLTRASKSRVSNLGSALACGC